MFADLQIFLPFDSARNLLYKTVVMFPPHLNYVAALPSET